MVYKGPNCCYHAVNINTDRYYNMTVHFCSDAHFFHSNIIRYSNRPFASVEDMNRQMIERWNKQVKHDDTVYHLGDFAFAKIEKIESILSQLNGKKHFINGNHDKEVKNNRHRLIEGGFVKSIKDYDEIYVDNQFIVLFHYGCRVWNKSHRNSWLLFGHSHNSLPPFGKSVDVGVDSTWVTGKAEYRPFSFYEIKEFMNKQPVMVVDHHGD